MRILIVTETYPPEINGVARTLKQIVDGLAGLGHELILARPTRSDRPASAASSNARIMALDVKGFPLPGYPDLQFGMPAGRLFNQLVSHYRIDIAYIATEGPLGLSALRACERFGIASLAGMHTNFHHYSRHYGAGFIAPLLLRYLRSFHNRASGTLVPTQSMADTLRSSGFQRLHVWPRGVDANLFDPQRHSTILRRQWGLNDNDLAVMYVGRVAAEKNIETAFDAFEMIRSRHRNARFVLVGDGPLRESVRTAHPHAVLCGQKVGCELAEHYASGDILLFPSTTETFGNVTLEAMASGLAVVAYDLAAAHELIDDGHNGLLAPSANKAAFLAAARRCADDKPLRLRLKHHARVTALLQGWPKLIKSLEHLMLSISTQDFFDDPESPAQSAKCP